ncbi:hypothetical protein D3C87_2211180 [compost metagenome]
MGVRAAQRLIGLISGEGREDPAPSIVAGPVQWRGSVTDRRPTNVSQLKIVREE